MSRSTLRSLLAVLLALSLLAAACGGDGDDQSGNETDSSGSSDSTSEPSEPPDPDESTTPAESTGDEPEPDAPLTASWTGVTESVIRLGFTISDLDELRRMGLVDIDRGDPQVALDALVDDVNARGGINGRTIEAQLEILVPLDPIAADDACVRLTEDTQVFAVLAPFVGPNAEVNSCLNDRNETILVGGTPTTDQLDSSRAPWISDSMFAERRLAGVVELFETEGLLGSTVGVTVTAREADIADTIVIPALEALGKTVVRLVQDVDPGDTVAGESQWATFVERLRVDGVDSVVMVENTATFGATQLVKGDLGVPLLIADTNNLTDTLGTLGELPVAELVGIIGSAGASPAETWELEASQDCVATFEAATGITVIAPQDVSDGESDWFTNIIRFCRPLRLFELAATAAGPDLTHESFLAAAESLGEVDLPGVVFASLGPDKLDATDAIRLVEFDPTLDEDGGATPRGDLVRVD